MKLIVLDRDGVINRDSADYIKSPREWYALPGSLEAIARLGQAGFSVVVATNQAGIARGLFDYDDLFAIHDRMLQQVSDLGGRIDAIFFCPHGPHDGCECRKPAPGLLKQVAWRYSVSLDAVPFVGDSLRDLQAATAAGARPVLVKTGNGRKTLAEQTDAVGRIEGLTVFDDLAAVAADLCGR
jgi:D-glycero-D-manno-heptose 1,7-bisphosphate phosphatase